MKITDIKTKYLVPHYRHTPYVFTGTIRRKYFNMYSDDDETVGGFVDTVMVWCIETFGLNPKVNTPPRLYWVWREQDMDGMTSCFGYFDYSQNDIEVRIQGHRTFPNLVNTIIHEYIHYLQPHSGYWHNRYKKMYGYTNSPYEIEARYFSYTHTGLCLTYLNATTSL